MPFKVLIRHKAKKKIEKCERDVKERMEGVFGLLNEPFKLHTVKLRGEEGSYRTRVGKHRILFVLIKDTVYILDFDYRGKVYKKG